MILSLRTYFSIFLSSANFGCAARFLRFKTLNTYSELGLHPFSSKMKFLYMITLAVGATAIAIEPRHHQGKGKGKGELDTPESLWVIEEINKID